MIGPLDAQRLVIRLGPLVRGVVTRATPRRPASRPAGCFRVLAAAAIFLALFAFAPAPCSAAEPGPSASAAAGAIPPSNWELLGTPPGKPLELTREPGGGFAGRFQVRNLGPGEVDLTRLLIIGSGPDGRASGVEATFEGDRPNAHLAANESRTIVVKWDPAEAPRLRQLYARVVVQSNPPRASPAALGIHAQAEVRAAWLFGHLLSWMLLVPLAGAAILALAALARPAAGRGVRWFVLGLAAAELGLAVRLFFAFDPTLGRLDGNGGYQFIERIVWIRSLGVEYFVGVDGISVVMVLLAALISFAAAAASFSVDRAYTRFAAASSLLAAAIIGVFVSLDLVLFYGFWELSLLPCYLLVRGWGGARKEAAAAKFFVYTIAGSVLVLLAFVALHFTSEPGFLVDGTPVAHTFAVPDLGRADESTRGGLFGGISLAKACWVALFVGFGVATPVFPFHTWAPDALEEAPTATSILMAGALLKAGLYGILRFDFGLLPQTTAWGAPAVAALGAVGIVYGAFCAMAQTDLKRLIAYATMSQMGYALLAMASLTPTGIEGAVVHMFNQGTIAALLFMLAGGLSDRARTKDIGAIGGAIRGAPWYAALGGLALMASIGLPGFSGFVGLLLALLGAFPVYRALTVLAAFGFAITAAYHLSVLEKVFAGRSRGASASSAGSAARDLEARDLRAREILSAAPLAALVLVLGVWPQPLLRLVDRGASDLSLVVSPAGPTRIAFGAGCAAGPAAPPFHLERSGGLSPKELIGYDRDHFEKLE